MISHTSWTIETAGANRTTCTPTVTRVSLPLAHMIMCPLRAFAMMHGHSVMTWDHGVTTHSYDPCLPCW